LRKNEIELGEVLPVQEKPQELMVGQPQEATVVGVVELGSVAKDLSNLLLLLKQTQTSLIKLTVSN
jgi:hypothetical protein